MLTGLQSDDHGFGQTGVLLAGLLNLPHATIIMQIEVQDGKMKLKRELEAGWFQWIECPLPAVLSIQSGINKVRYATLKGIMAAKKKEIATVTRESLGVTIEPTQKIEKIYVPHENQEDGIPYRHAEGSGRQAGREAQVRSAGDLSHENPRDHGTTAREVEQRQLRDAGGAQQIAATAIQALSARPSSAKALQRWRRNWRRKMSPKYCSSSTICWMLHARRILHRR